MQSLRVLSTTENYYFAATAVRQQTHSIWRQNFRAETKWCADLAAMCQVSLVGYAVGGAFLSLSYFDLPYNIMAMVALTRKWISDKAWENEPNLSGETQPESKKRFWSRIIFQ